MKIWRGLMLCALLGSATVLADEQKKLKNLLADIWQFELSVNPVMATSLGVHEHDDKLQDMSPEALAEQNKAYQAYLAELNKLEAGKLERSAQISLLMQKYRLQNHVDRYAFKAHYMPITSEYGFHNGLATLAGKTRFASEQDYKNYLQRLSQIPRHFTQQINWMKQGLKTGLSQPKVVLAGFEDTVSGYIEGKLQTNPFYAPFVNLDDKAFSQQSKQALIEGAERIIKQQVIPAYQGFYRFLVDEYIPQAKDKIAAQSLPDGQAYYQNRAKYFTTTELTPEQIHQIGLQEVARIRADMQQVIEQLEFNGDIQAFIHFLRTDPQFYAKSADELLRYAAYVSKQMDAKLPKLFYTLPRTPYGVAPVPDQIAPKYTTGRYLSPSRDDQPGYYWVNTYALDKRPLYAIPALTLHEAVPGHHLQISLAREMAELPAVRRYTYLSAFGEGWGLYSEFLGKEVGIYQTPYEEFGRLSYDMWRACRLVVDTGMHMLGWSRQQALDYMLTNTALSEHNVRTEIDRYISWPAQALSYKIGEIEIRKLRTQAEHILADKFDLRAFHDAILAHGPVPLPVLRENISDFIQAQQGK